MKSRRSWWLIFGACTLAAGVALAWVSMVVLRLEAEAQHQASVRLALWRMDYWAPAWTADRPKSDFFALPESGALLAAPDAVFLLHGAVNRAAPHSAAVEAVELVKHRYGPAGAVALLREAEDGFVAELLASR